MPDSVTTMKVSGSNRDALRQIADEEGLTLDQALGRLLRRERQRRMGEQLSGGLSADERAIIRGGAHAVGRIVAPEARAGG